MHNAANLILNLIEGHAIQSHLTDEQDKQIFTLLHATASRLESQIDTISNFDTAVTALDMLSHLLNSYRNDNCGGCCMIVRKDDAPFDAASYDPANTNLIILSSRKIWRPLWSVSIIEPDGDHRYLISDDATDNAVEELRVKKLKEGDAALMGVPKRGTRSTAPASRRRRPVRRSRR